jgi:hypothetical protein
MIAETMSHVGGKLPSLFATLTRTLPPLGAGLNLFDKPAEAAGNASLKYSLSAGGKVDVTV